MDGSADSRKHTMATNIEKRKTDLSTEINPSLSSNNDLSYTYRDLSLISTQFSFSFIENYAKQNNKSSGVEHMSKGIKYFSEGYINNITCKIFYYILSTTQA